MKYTGPFKKMKKRAELAQLRARIFSEAEREMIEHSDDRLDTSRDLLRERVKGLPPG